MKIQFNSMGSTFSDKINVITDSVFSILLILIFLVCFFVFIYLTIVKLPPEIDMTLYTVSGASGSGGLYMKWRKQVKN